MRCKRPVNPPPPRRAVGRTPGRRVWRLRRSLDRLAQGLSPGRGGELGEAVLGMGGQAFEEVAQVGVGVESVAASGGDEAVEDGRAAAALVAAGEDPVLAAHGDRAQGSFGRVVVDGQVAVLGVAAQGLPLELGVGGRFPEGALGQDARGFALNPQGEAVEHRHRVALAHRGALVGRQISRSILDLVELAHEGQGRESPRGVAVPGVVELAPGVGHARDLGDQASGVDSVVDRVGVGQELREAYAMQDAAVPDAGRRAALTDFFFWTSWACTTERPGTGVTYTNNWPHEELVGNHPTGANVLWTMASVILLLAGVGGLIWWRAFRGEREPEVTPPAADPFGAITPTASMRAVVVS